MTALTYWMGLEKFGFQRDYFRPRVFVCVRFWFSFAEGMLSIPLSSTPPPSQSLAQHCTYVLSKGQRLFSSLSAGGGGGLGGPLSISPVLRPHKCVHLQGDWPLSPHLTRWEDREGQGSCLWVFEPGQWVPLLPSQS